MSNLNFDMFKEGGDILNYVRTEMCEGLPEKDRIIYYGTKYYSNPEQFVFESGELDWLMGIVKKINNDGEYQTEYSKLLLKNNARVIAT